MARSSAYSDSSAISLIVKYALFFINLIMFMASGALVGLMIWLLVLKEKKVVDFGDFVFDSACWFLLTGCCALVISFFGWLGSLREHLTFLSIYLGLMTFFFIIEVVGIIFLFVIIYAPGVPQKLGIYPEASLSDAIVKYRNDADMQDLIDGLQIELKCCGTSNDDEGYKDWSKNEYFNCTSGTITGENCFVPFSCCIRKDGTLENFMCGRGMQSPNITDSERKSKIYVRGCFKALTETMTSNVLVVAGVIIGILLPQIFMTFMGRRLEGQIKIQKAKWDRRPPDQPVGRY